MAGSGRDAAQVQDLGIESATADAICRWPPAGLPGLLMDSGSDDDAAGGRGGPSESAAGGSSLQRRCGGSSGSWRL